MIIRVAIPTNIVIAKSGATVVGSVMTLSALEPLSGFSGHWVRLSTFDTKNSLSSSFPDDSSFEMPLLKCLDICNFPWLPL